MKDAISVSKYPDIKGVSNLFVNHAHCEAGAMSDDPLETSKENKYEVEMALMIVQHLLRQGYDPSRIVVLTPTYQQRALRNSFSKSGAFDVILNERDREDLEREGLIDDLDEEGNELGSKERNYTTAYYEPGKRFTLLLLTTIRERRMILSYFPSFVATQSVRLAL